ncbi:MAG: putative tRNA (cytidine(34)-2'-O)-methyltransferase [bacterium ADurb.BinA186]|nr:MAG: putative tRNA (cytidine(34)-2'-O)-methyltransferase [bacterium ADurb.BinA186]
MKAHIITSPTLHLVLDRPCIAGNIAAIVRLSVATQCAVHVCGPLIFDKADRTKWRAGLDYFFGARLHFHQSLERCLALLGQEPWLLEVGSERRPWDVSLVRSSVVVLGPETGSIKSNIIEHYRDRMISLPQIGPVRSLNLAQCAAIVSFEAIRQQLKNDA